MIRLSSPIHYMNTMRIKTPLLALLFILSFSCNKSEENITEDPQAEEPVVEDEKKPELTVSGFSDIIETTTVISVSVVDDSTVETKIVHDGEALATSTEKQFHLPINPYGIPVGPTDFTVISKDAKGNEVSETHTVEIKHLLMTYGYSSQENDSPNERWLFFNDLNGKELAVIDPIVGNLKIYTDEIILEDKILFSTANLITWTPSSPTSDKTLSLITYKIPLAGTRPEGGYNTYIEPENTAEVTLNGIPLVNGSPDYYAFGRNYNTSAYNGDDLKTTLTIKHDATQPICIRTNRWGGSKPKFDGKKENYRYYLLTPETGNTNLVVEADQLIPAENNLKVDIPEHDPGTLFCNRDGFENAENLAAYIGSSVYDKDSANETEIVDYLDLPIFPDFIYYDTIIEYAKNGSSYSTRGSDANLDVTMPNWITSSQTTDTQIEVVADNQEVDYYSIRFGKSENSASGSRRVQWSFNVFGEDGSPKTSPRLKIPELITETIGEPYFQTTDDLETNGLIAVDYAKYDSYDEIVEWFAFGKNSPIGGENKYRQISYSSSSYSGKSDIANRPWYLDAPHGHRIDENGQVRKW